jgi:hypothetical protein
MAVDLSKLEVGDTIELRAGSKHVVERIRNHEGYVQPWEISTSSLRIYEDVFSHRWFHNADGTMDKRTGKKPYPGDIMAIHKKEKPVKQQATEVPAAQALAEGKLGWYRTRDGGLAEIIMIAPSRLLSWTYKVHGFRNLSEKEGARETGWTAEGKYSTFGDYHEDLITYLGTTKPKRKVKRTVEVVQWANIYPHQEVICTPYETKASADDAASFHRIACVELRGSYEVEEEVDQ